MPEEEVAAAAEAAAPRRTRIPMPAGMSPLAPATVSQIVGRLEHADPGRGEAMIASLPPEVREACRDPFSARAAVLAAVADPRPEVAAIGWDALAWSTDAALLAETRRLHAAVAPLGTDATLSVVLLALPALRRMSGGQIDDFLAALRTLVASDGVVTFQEHALAALIALHMGAWPRPAVTTPDDRVTAAAVDLLAALARAGSADAEQADRAFALGVRELGIRGTVSRDPEASWDTFHRALKTVRAGRPDRRRRVVAAAAWTASEDGVIDPTESALLRLVADAVESPLPLLGETYSRG